MNFGINIGYFAKNLTMAKAAEEVSKAGFTKVDYTPPVLNDNWESVMKESVRIFEANGISVHQTHVPFNRYGTYGDKHKLCVDRCMEATAFMGAKYAAVHGDEFDFEKMTYSEESALNYNHEYFLDYVKKAEKYGFKMAFETVFEDNPERKRFTANPEDLMKLILSFNSDHAVCCWDFGHANVSFPLSAAEWIVKFGSLIQCTHVHDNAGNDSHQIPLTGDINWENMMNALKKIRYNGVFSIEYSHGVIPESIVPTFLSLTNEAVLHLSRL